MSGDHDATIVLVRHGQTTWVAEGRFQGSSDPPLSSLGEAQAAAVARRLTAPQDPPALPVPAGSPVRIRHSPLTRAADTARMIGSAGGGRVPLTPDLDLAELAQGDWEGRTQSEVVMRWPIELAAWRSDPVHHHAPGGEALPDAAARARDAVARILADVGARLSEDATIGASTASQVLGYTDPAFSSTAKGLASPLEPWTIVVAHDGILRLVLLHLLQLPIDHYWVLPFGLCAISVVEVRSGRPRLRAHNLSGHLPALV